MEQLEVYRNIVHDVQNINNVELDRHPQRIIRDKILLNFFLTKNLKRGLDIAKQMYCL